jgi:hypothetical protein
MARAKIAAFVAPSQVYSREGHECDQRAGRKKRECEAVAKVAVHDNAGASETVGIAS